LAETTNVSSAFPVCSRSSPDRIRHSLPTYLSSRSSSSCGRMGLLR
jgi:hypothetical protein